MSNAVVTMSQTGDSNQPSPSLWKDSRNTLLEDLGLGRFAHHEFLGGPLVNTTITSALLARTTVSSGLSIDGDDDTVLTYKASEEGGYLDLETDGDDNDAVAIFSEPLGKIVRNSGKKLWMEARLELGAIADQGVFVGLVEEAGASRDVIADDAGSNGVIGESLVGFIVDNGDTNAADAIYRKDAGAVVNVLNDVTNATAIPTADRASLLADTEVKLGIRFDGYTKLEFYANGVKVAEQDVDSTVDQSKSMSAIIALKTGAIAAQSIAVDWLRYGYQERS